MYGFPWRAGTQYGPELLGPHVEMTSKLRPHEVFRTNTKTSEFRAIGFRDLIVQWHLRDGQAWDEDGVKNRPILRPRGAKMSQEESKRDQDTAK